MGHTGLARRVVGKRPPSQCVLRPRFAVALRPPKKSAAVVVGVGANAEPGPGTPALKGAPEPRSGAASVAWNPDDVMASARWQRRWRPRAAPSPSPGSPLPSTPVPDRIDALIRFESLHFDLVRCVSRRFASIRFGSFRFASVGFA